MNLSLRRGERIYINGAVIRPDRKVCLELLNDVTFLLEHHVMQVAEATTPLKQLYFVVQLMMMSPNDAEQSLKLFREMAAKIGETVQDSHIVDALALVSAKVHENRAFEALKKIREIFPLEDRILESSGTHPKSKVA